MPVKLLITLIIFWTKCLSLRIIILSEYELHVDLLIS